MNVTKHKSFSLFRLILSAIVAFSLISTQAVPISDTVLLKQRKIEIATESPQACPADEAAALVVKPASKEAPKNMDPAVPCCKQTAIVSVQAVPPGHHLDDDISVESSFIAVPTVAAPVHAHTLPSSRASVNSDLALQATLVGARPSGTS